MEMELTDKILLQFGEKRRHLQSSEIDAERADKEIAISNLVKDGYVTARENGSNRYDKYISMSITAKGKARQTELKRLIVRSCGERYCDAVSRVWKLSRPSVGRIVEGIIIAVVSAIISGAVCFWFGRATAPSIPDKASDNYKQEHSNNVTICFD